MPEPFGVGAVVELKSGGGRMTVTGEPDGTGLLEWISCAANGPAGFQLVRVPAAALRLADADRSVTAELPIPEQIEIAERSALAHNKAAVETLRDTFKLRAGCDRADHAAEDAAAEYRAYREHICSGKLIRFRPDTAAAEWSGGGGSSRGVERLFGSASGACRSPVRAARCKAGPRICWRRSRDDAGP